MSSFKLFIISVSSDICSTCNAVEDHNPPPRLSGVDLIASLHTIYAYLTGLLLTLMGIKYQGSNTDPFSDHPTLMMLLLISIFVYFISLIITLRRSDHRMSDHSSKLMVGVSHFSGVIACELLLLVLLSPLRSFFINVSSLALIAMLVLCYKYLLHLLHARGSEEVASQMIGLEADATISSTPA